MQPLTLQEQTDIIKDVFGLMSILQKESERASVILAAARLDADLEMLLKHVLVPHPGGIDPLFDGDRMLGTFSAKIAMAHRLGIIDSDFEHALQILRKIRNDFAHQMESESLSSPKQKARLSIILRWAQSSNIYELGCKMAPIENKSPEQLQFTISVLCMAVAFKRGLRTLLRVNVGKPLSLV